MYFKPSNSLDFKKGFALGVDNGRRIERKLCLILMIFYVGLFSVIWKVVTHFWGGLIITL